MNFLTADSCPKERICIDKKAQKPTQEKIDKRREVAINQLQNLRKRPNSRLSPLKRDFIEEALKNQEVSKDKWTRILYRFVTFILEDKIDSQEARRLSQVISPFYLLRVLTYFQEIGDLTPEEVENIITYEKKRLFKLL